MSKTLKIEVEKFVPRMELEEILAFQGELKSLAPDDEEKLRKSILERGFCIPMFVWKNKNTTNILDGHQRLRVLTKLKDEGYAIPPIPVIPIQAKTEQEAKEKLLLISSQYGKVERAGLFEFLKGLDEKMIVTDFKLPELDAQSFLDEFFSEADSIIETKDNEGEVKGDLRSLGGNGIKMLQIYLSEEQHADVIKTLSFLQEKYQTKNATDTVLQALQDARNKN